VLVLYVELATTKEFPFLETFLIGNQLTTVSEKQISKQSDWFGKI
jgi:hypothetical protein